MADRRTESGWQRGPLDLPQRDPVQYGPAFQARLSGQLNAKNLKFIDIERIGRTTAMAGLTKAGEIRGMSLNIRRFYGCALGGAATI
jgi:hypothetical protein